MSLIPVRCFDARLNTRLTREKALAYAQVALGRHITGKSTGTVELTVRDAEVNNSRTEGHLAELTVRFPKDGVKVRRATSDAQAADAVENVANLAFPVNNGLLTAKNDQLATLQSLVEVLQSEMPQVPTRQSDAKLFYQSVAEHEEGGDRRFEQFRSAVETDQLLLKIERDEIIRAIKAAENTFLTQLRSRVKQFDLNKRFSDIEIEEKYQPYLAANPLLMEVTGAKIIHLSDRTVLVIAAASTALKDGSAKERLRAERVCKTKALASVVAEKQGVQVARVERLNEKTQLVIDEEGEKETSVSELLQLTRSRVEGITKDMPVIGTWKSKDGGVFYLAIGAILDVPE